MVPFDEGDNHMIVAFASRHAGSLARSALAIACTLAVGACSAEPPSAAESEAEPETSSIAQPILNGTPIAFTPSLSAVAIGNCSAVALDQEWVLTAKSCAAGLAALTSTATRVAFSDTRQIREIHLNPDQDVALLRVFPFVNDVPRLWLWNYPPSFIGTRDLNCFGRGSNTLQPATGADTWWSATMHVSSYTASTYRLLPNALGQIQTAKDMGGPCLETLPGYPPRITGIQSSASWNCRPGVIRCSFDDAISVNYATQVAITAAVNSWITGIRNRSILFFYRKSDGIAYVSALESGGGYTSISQLNGFSKQWTHVVALHNGAILFYNRNDGTSASGRVDKNGVYSSGTSFNLLPNWLHIAAVGSDALFFLDANGVGRTARIDAYGTYTPGLTYYGFASNYTHVAGTAGGSLFLFNNASRTATTASVSSNLQYLYGGAISGFANWTHVAAYGPTGLFFYNAATGARARGFLSAGLYQSQPEFPGVVPFSQTSLSGAGNGGLLFRDASGYGTAARLDASNTLVSQTLSGFATDWTNVTAE